LTLLRANDADAPLAKAVKRGHKGPITIVVYLLAIGLAFFWPMAAVALYVAVAIKWLVPDKRFEGLID
jgi:hypothetical protein